MALSGCAYALCFVSSDSFIFFTLRNASRLSPSSHALVSVCSSSDSICMVMRGSVDSSCAIARTSSMSTGTCSQCNQHRMSAGRISVT